MGRRNKTRYTAALMAVALVSVATVTVGAGGLYYLWGSQPEMFLQVMSSAGGGPARDAPHGGDGTEPIADGVREWDVEVSSEDGEMTITITEAVDGHCADGDAGCVEARAGTGIRGGGTADARSGTGTADADFGMAVSAYLAIMLLGIQLGMVSAFGWLALT